MTRTSVDPDFDVRIADWLEDDPDHAPGPVLQTVVAAFPLITQRRASRLPWRTQSMIRIALVGAAAVLVAAVGVGLSLNSSSQAPNIGASSASPTQPASAPPPTPALPNVTGTFSSPMYGYSIGVDPEWTTTAATVSADDPSATDDNLADHIAVTGTDTTIAIHANDLGDQTFEESLAVTHQGVLDDDTVPSSCKATEPSFWPTAPVGSETGVLMTLCNFAVVYAEHGGRVYSFEWGHSSFDPGSHFDFLDFKRLLETVEFEAPAAS